MRRRLFQFAAYVVAALLIVIGCTRTSLLEKDNSQIPIVITPTLQDATSTPATKAKTGSFDTGDRLGLYLTNSGLSLHTSNNITDNHLMTVHSDGNMYGGNLYYYGRDAVLDFYAYYPYNADVSASPLAFDFTVSTNQNESKDAYNWSDLCYATARGVSANDPSVASGSANLTFRHMLSQLVFDITVDKYIGGKQVIGITSVKITNMETCLEFNLSSGILRAPADYKYSDIYAHQISDDSNNPNNDKTYISSFALILPPQEVEATETEKLNLIAATIKFSDNSTMVRWFTADSYIAYGSGESLTYSFTITDHEEAILLDTAPTIGPWVGVDINIGANGSGDSDDDFNAMTPEISNNFNVLWENPASGYKDATTITVTIRNPTTGETKEYEVPIENLNSSDEDFGSFEFELNDPDAPFGYPFEITNIVIKDNEGDIIDSCESLAGATVPAPGDYTIAIVVNNIVGVSQGVVNDWDDFFTSGNISGAGVVNSFTVRLHQNGNISASDIQSVVFTIGNIDYSWTSFTKVRGNKFFIELSGMTFPGCSPSLPTMMSYPYTIARVKFIGAGSSELATATAGFSVGVMGAFSLDLTI